MAKLSEILSEMDDDVSVQYLSESLVGIKDKKKTNDTEITFATTEVNCNSAMDGKKTAVIVWVDIEKYNEACKAINNK